MADTQELDESMIIGEGEDLNGGSDGAMMETETAGAAPDAAASRKPRAKRASVKSMEGRVAAIEQRAEAFAHELAQLTGVTEQLAHLSGKIAKLEESLEARSSNGAGTAHDGAGIADQVRQMDERLQKLAYVLAQQNWNRP
jgi:predicted RNase H-like nuclease (RuvC/YqgF family)